MVLPPDIEQALQTYLTSFEDHLRGCVELALIGQLTPESHNLKALLRRATDDKLALSRAINEFRALKPD